MVRGEIRGETIDHLCRVRACVNPWHMEVVSLVENVMRGIGFGVVNRGLVRCRRGHEDWGIQVKRGKVHRWCRVCKSMTNALRYRRLVGGA